MAFICNVLCSASSCFAPVSQNYETARSSSNEQVFPRKAHNIFARSMLFLTRPIALYGLFQGYFSSLYWIVDVKRPLLACRELLKDLGGEEIFIPSGNGAQVNAMYFDKDLFLMRENEVFIKWKAIFQKDQRLVNFLEINLEGKNLRELFRLPKSSQEDCTSSKKAAISCVGANAVFEANPQSIMQSLYRGLHHIAFNYRGINKSTGSPDYEGTCEDAYEVTRYMLERFKYSAHDLLIIGTSLGAGPALFTAAKIEGLDVVVDRSFCRLSEVRVNPVIRPAFRYLAENFYTYPNEEWIMTLQGRACIIQAKDDTLMQPFHADRLLSAYIKGKISSEKFSITPEALKVRSYLEASGGHNGKWNGDPEYSWYADEMSQKKYSEFIKDIPIIGIIDEEKQDPSY